MAHPQMPSTKAMTKGDLEEDIKTLVSSIQQQKLAHEASFSNESNDNGRVNRVEQRTPTAADI